MSDEHARTALLAVAVVAAMGAVVTAVGVPVGSTAVSGGPDSTHAPVEHTARTGPLSGLPTGAPPAVDHLLGRTYAFADGDKVKLDVEPAPSSTRRPTRAGS